MEETGKICPTNLISDAPAKEDAFKSHDRVARAIVGLVNDEPGGLTIGVEGAWGTGKSTIIRFVIDALTPDKNIAIVSFDAWAHQGDPLRRSFLERLIGVITDKGWVDQERWKNVLDTLARRIHKSSTTTTPTLTKEGRWLAASVLLIPVGAAILEPLIEAEPRIWPDGLWGLFLQVLTWLSALGLSFAPFVVALFLMRNRGKGKPFWGFFADEQTTREDSESTEDPEPTSLEFSKRFTELLEEALKSEAHKVVIIVDNLDRIPEDFARSMWSTMRTFLEHGEYQRKEWFSRIWVVVPYAIQSLRKTLGAYSESKDKSQGSGNEDHETDGVFSFIDKVFQIHFYVSPPVLSDWKDYLTKHMQKAFPRHGSETELHRIYRTWTQNAPRAERPTPRDLVIFINDIGALHRQWQDAFPLPHMAYYSLVRRKYDDVAAELLRGTVPAPADKELLGENLADTVAALYFNRDVAHARQILLKPELTKLLAKGDPKELLEFESKHAGLFTVLEHELVSILSDWGTAETATVARAAKCLLSEGVMSKASPAEAKSIKERLFTVCEGTDHWQPLDVDVIGGLALTVAANRKLEYAARILSTLRASYEMSQIAQRADIPDVSTWLKLYIDFVKEIKSRDLLPKTDSRELLPGAQREWVLAGQYLHDENSSRDLVADAAPNFEISTLAQEYIRVIQSDAFDKPHVVSILLSFETEFKPNYQQIAQAIQKRLVDYPATISSRAYQLVYSLWVMGRADPGVASIEVAMTANGQILHYLQTAITSKDHSTTALTMFLIIKDRPQLNQDVQFQNSQAGLSNIQALLSEPEKFPDALNAFTIFIDHEMPIGMLATLFASTPSARKWLLSCVMKLTEAGTLGRKFNAVDLIKVWQILDESDRNSGALPAQLSKIISAINKDRGVDNEVMKLQCDQSIARLASAIVLQHEKVPSDLKSWIEHGLDAIQKDLWISQISEDGELISLLTQIRRKESGVFMGVKYLDALTTAADHIADGQPPGNRAVDRWPEFFEPLKPDLRIRLKEQLLDIAKQKRGNISAPFFAIFESEALKLESLKDDDETVEKLFTPLLQNRNIAGLILISKSVSANSNSLEKLGQKHHIAEFVERVQEALPQTKGDQSDTLIKQIATQLRIEPKPDVAPQS